MISKETIRQVVVRGSCAGIFEIQCNDQCPCFDKSKQRGGCTRWGGQSKTTRGSVRESGNLVLPQGYLEVFKKLDSYHIIKELLGEI